ncbi:unnamed protein product [Prorocentrum cordatum]|uniref:Uncharacterized protein n=1 Tax=Prorocentrum cordatum TaxID=2364126 RepID=A0ABN9W8T3_9DINO|nr:unnamed protein product [Polarella glacialis]
MHWTRGRGRHVPLALVLFVVLFCGLLLSMFPDDDQGELRTPVHSGSSAEGGPARLSASAVMDLVIVGFRENLSWIEGVVANITPPPRVKLICKGELINDQRCQRIENRGTEEFGFLSHIIENYEKLAPITMFMGANPLNTAFDCIAWRSLHYVLAQVDTVQKRMAFPGFVALRVSGFDPDFDVWHYHAHADGETSKLCRPSVSPFGEWYQRVVERNLSKAACAGQSSSGIFAVSAGQIRRYGVAHYERLREEVLRCPGNAFTAGHYIERSWMPMFGPCLPAGRAGRGGALAEALLRADCGLFPSVFPPGSGE